MYLAQTHDRFGLFSTLYNLLIFVIRCNECTTGLFSIHELLTVLCQSRVIIGDSSRIGDKLEPDNTLGET